MNEALSLDVQQIPALRRSRACGRDDVGGAAAASHSPRASGIVAGMLRIALLLPVLALSACAFVTPDRIHYDWIEGRMDAPDGAPAATSPGEAPDTVIGLALSGGGARSAVFAAAALEALHARGLLTPVTHLSSVSGGSFAATWHVLNRPDACGPDPLGADAETCADAFDAFQAAMRTSYVSTLARRELAPNRFGSPTRRLSSLQTALDAAFIGGATFADLPDAPALYINAGRYDDGRRFVFSREVLPDEPPGVAPLNDPRLRAASFALPGCPRATPEHLPVALAVATSAAFPVAFGPATFRVPAGCDGSGEAFWHLGDGGVVENLGLETLEEVALRALASDAPPARVLLIALDAEMLADPADLFADGDLRLWTSNPGRLVDVAMERGRGYHDLVWADARAAITAETGAPFTVLRLRYTDARLTAWPAACAREAERGVSIDDHIAAIPTGLGISACDADLMEEAARQLVDAMIAEHGEALRALGFPVIGTSP